MRKPNRIIVKTYPNGVPLTCLEGHLLRNTGEHVSQFDAEHHTEDELERYQGLAGPQVPRKPLQVTHDVHVNHQVTHGRRPRPTMMTFTLYNHLGESYVMPPINVRDGGYPPRVEIPMWFLTGKPSEAPARMDVRVEYDDMKDRGY